MSEVTFGQRNIIRGEFEEVEGESSKGKYFGVVRKNTFNPEEVAHLLDSYEIQPPFYVGCQIGNCFVREIKTAEKANIPPKRFVNALSLHDFARNTSFLTVPVPLGLLYRGSMTDLITGEFKGYYVSKFVEGETFMHAIPKMTKQRRDGVFLALGHILGDLGSNGIYPFDFAPRDIILFRERWPVIVDTEHVSYLSCCTKEDMMAHRAEQITEFRKEYAPFLGKNGLEEAMQLVFRSKE